MYHAMRYVLWAGLELETDCGLDQEYARGIIRTPGWILTRPLLHDVINRVIRRPRAGPVTVVAFPSVPLALLLAVCAANTSTP